MSITVNIISLSFIIEICWLFTKYSYLIYFISDIYRNLFSYLCKVFHQILFLYHKTAVISKDIQQKFN